MAVGAHKLRLGRSLASLIGEGEGADFGEVEGQRIVAEVGFVPLWEAGRAPGPPGQ